MSPKETPSKLVGSPKKRKWSAKKKKKLSGNLALRRISDSSFNISRLSQSMVSTPRNRPRKPQWKKNDGTPLNLSGRRKRKGNQNLSTASVGTKRRRGERNEPAVEPTKPGASTKPCDTVSPATTKPSASSSEPPKKKRKIQQDVQGSKLSPGGEKSRNASKTSKPFKPRLPVGTEPKSPGNLSTLFRNDYVGVGHEFGKAGGPGTDLPASDNSVIVIDDDDTLKEKTVIEAVGEELMQLASDEPVPETPRTLINKQQRKDNKENETIVLDDTQDQRPESPDSIIVIEEIPAKSVQEIASQYFTPAVSMDFIPLNRNPVSPPYKTVTKRRSLVKSYKGAKSNQGFRPTKIMPPNVRPNFVPNFAPNFNFISGPRPGEVFRFSGSRGRNRAPAPAVNQGPTLYSEERQDKTGLRPIVVDGSNIAFAHGLNRFSVKGIEMVLKYFKERGHSPVVAFLPQFRLGADPEKRATLKRLEEEGSVIFTPSRRVDGACISSYDDRMILDYAVEKEAIVISRDNYRDMYEENAKFRETIEKRLLMPTFVGDTLMFPQDPLGRNGPRLDDFLKF